MDSWRARRARVAAGVLLVGGGLAACGEDGPETTLPVTFTEVAEVGAAVDLAWRQGDPALYVVDQAGTVTRVGDGDQEVVLDISGLTEPEGERGLLGLTFDPTGALAYVNYTDRAGDTVVAEHAVDEDGRFDPEGRVVLEIDQPYANHNGGDLAFGPDGMLYIGMGDGGDADDPERRATDLTTLLGKLLRIDPRPSGAQPYTVPDDNPYVGRDDAAPEIWASGLRNPWRFSFDRETGDLWIADVGQNEVEEINVAPATNGRDAGRGLGFGWSAFEGDRRHNEDVPADGHTPPLFTYTHDEGCSISGGIRVRGDRVPELTGTYVYGDYCSGTVWALEVHGEGDAITAGRAHVVGEVEAVTAVVDGPGLEVYVLSGTGSVVRIDPPTS